MSETATLRKARLQLREPSWGRKRCTAGCFNQVDEYYDAARVVWNGMIDRQQGRPILAMVASAAGGGGSHGA